VVGFCSHKIQKNVTNSFFVLCNGVKSDFMACVRTSPQVGLGTTELQSQLDAWLKAVSVQHWSHWLQKAGWRAAGPPIRPGLSCAGPARCSQSVSIEQPATFQVAGCFSMIGQECTACFKFAADSDLGLKEIHVDYRDGYVRVGAGGAAGSEPDIRHQPPGKTI
jgi:hypothetical protein